MGVWTHLSLAVVRRLFSVRKADQAGWTILHRPCEAVMGLFDIPKMKGFGMLAIFAARHPRTTWCALGVQHFGQTGSFANLYSITQLTRPASSPLHRVSGVHPV